MNGSWIISKEIYILSWRELKRPHKERQKCKGHYACCGDKTVEPERIMKILDEGVVDLGENRVQELTKKYDILNSRKCKWHLIGHLQTNKVKYIVDKVSLIHSVDRIELAREIQKEPSLWGKL